MDQSSEFHVQLNGLKLPAAAEKQIARAIQSTLMTELGKMDLGRSGSSDSVAIHIPKEWLGLWLQRLRQAELGGTDGIPKGFEPVTR